MKTNAKTTKKSNGKNVISNIKTAALQNAANDIEIEKTSKKTKKIASEPYIAEEFRANDDEKKEILAMPIESFAIASFKREKKEKNVVVKEKGPSLVSVLTPLIEEAKYTKKELVIVAVELLPHLSVSTIQTILTDAKNPKYNKFEKLVVIDENGILKFAA